MTMLSLGDFVRIKGELEEDFACAMKGERVVRNHYGLDFGMHLSAIEVKHSHAIIIFHQMVSNRLGPPGGPAPVLGGSFDYNITQAPDGSILLHLKSYTDQQTLDALRKQFNQPKDFYDFR